MTNWQSLAELSTDIGLKSIYLIPLHSNDRFSVIFDRLVHALLGLYG